jgi:glycosyltransferase involved in cell wall biosynthesis
VLHLITRLIVGGAQENTIASVERVDPGRFDSRLWCGPQTGPEGSLIHDARGRGADVRILPNLVREISPLKDLAMLVQLSRLLRRDRFDIVHTHCTKAGVLGRVAAKLAGVPHIVHTHHGWSFHDRMHPLRRRLFVAAERALALWTRPMISVSNKTTEVGLASGVGRREDYRLIRSGIPLNRFRPGGGREVRAALGIAEGDFVVGSVGRLAPQKNPVDFLRCAAMLLERHAGVTFVYVGDGPLRGEIEDAAADMGISDRVRLLGVRRDVPDLLRAMDVFILTSLWEGLPRVVLQALATGVPVVAYDTAGILEAVKDGQNGFLVPHGSVDAMVGHLDRLASDPGELEKLSTGAVDGFGREFTEDGMIEGLERLYGELVGGE